MEGKRPQSCLPEDIVAEVLVRLPVKSLIRFTVVCKSWYSLITNPRFILSHYRILSREEDPCFLNVYHHKGTVFSENTLTVGEEFSLPYSFAQTEIIGYCNGLLCLMIIHGTGKGIFLYNPSIQRLKLIESFRGSELDTDFNYGFGYHEQSNDHRLVKFQESPINKVQVYSLRADSWRELQVSPPRKRRSYYRSKSGLLYLNGATHWWTSIEIVVDVDVYVLRSIVAFDFSEEVFREMVLPIHFLVDMDDFVQINEFQGSLAMLVSNDFSDNGYQTAALWVMDEYGVSESWKEKFSNIPFSDILQPRGFTRNGLVILSCSDGSKSLRFYDLQNNQFKSSEHNMVVKDIFDFTENLFLLDHENVLRKYQSADDLFYWNIE